MANILKVSRLALLVLCLIVGFAGLVEGSTENIRRGFGLAAAMFVYCLIRGDFSRSSGESDEDEEEESEERTKG